MTQEIRAITLMQPYASLVALGHKHFETRQWSTRYRGPLVIHAGQRMWIDWQDRRFLSRLAECGIPDPRKLPFSAGVAIGNLKEIYRTDDLRPLLEREGREMELAFGDYRPERFAWLISDIRIFPEPIPAKGYQGLWYWKQLLPEEIVEL